VKTPTALPKPKWWQLYLSFPLLVALFLVDSRLRFSEAGHETLQLGSLAFEFIFVQVWLHRNASALRHIDDDKLDSTLVTYIFPTPSPTEIQDEPLQAVSWPREIKGVLGDTFEWDPMEVEPAAWRSGGGTKDADRK
jgi:hypothetical protein